jgi:hypothetical protein
MTVTVSFAFLLLVDYVSVRLQTTAHIIRLYWIRRIILFKLFLNYVEHITPLFECMYMLKKGTQIPHLAFYCHV